MLSTRPQCRPLAYARSLVVHQCCAVLALTVAFMLRSQVQSESGTNGQEASFRRQLADAVQRLETIDWLVPPMLQAR